MSVVAFNEPYPKQVAFFLSRARFTAYGGARGGGKSDAMRSKAIALCLRYAGIQILFLRRTYQEVRENHLLPALKILDGLAKCNSIENALRFPNGSRLKFGYCKSQTDLLQYQGQAYEAIFLEECTQFPEAVFTAMTECNRSSKLMREPFAPRMYLSCNPGGVGHAWFKRLFVDRVYREKERANDYVFIQANVFDNPYLLENSPDYVRSLENLPHDRRRAMLYGDWNVFEGQYFPEFQRETHLCEPFRIPAHWVRWRVFDYGYDMFACYFVAMDENRRAYFYKEIYEGRDKRDVDGNPGEGLTIAEAAKRMCELTATDEDIRATIAPPDMWNRRQETGRSAAEIFMEYGVPLVRAANERVQGWYDVKDWLKLRADGKPGVMLFTSCVHLARSIPLLLHDEKNPNDVAKNPHEFTHAPDALRYFCAARPWATDAPRDDDAYDFDDEMRAFGAI